MSYIGAEPTTAAFPFDQFSGNGTTTAFTLTYAPASTTSVIVAISGVVQNPNLYSIVGTTLTFSPAPPTGTNNISVLYLGLPVIGVSSPGNTSYRSSQDFTATAGQTTFTTTGSYTVGFLDVYRNGVRLGASNFTATNGTTVVLGTACNAGDLVTIVFFTLVSVANAMPQSGGTFTGNIAVPTGTLYPLVSDTAKSATGTSVDFTGIPSWAKRVTVMFSGVSTNGASVPLIQLGTSSGVENTGYVSGTGVIQGASVTQTTNVMKNTIKLSDFNFQFTGYGHYKVTYTSPKTGKQWTTITSNMQLIDATKGAEQPKIKDLLTLKSICKS
jgi:hypothetical protein